MKRPPYRQMILDLLATRKTMKQEDILASITIPESTLSRWLSKLTEEGVVRIASWTQSTAHKARANYTTRPGKHYPRPNSSRATEIRTARYRRYRERKRLAAAAQKESTYVPLNEALSIFMGSGQHIGDASEKGTVQQQQVHHHP